MNLILSAALIFGMAIFSALMLRDSGISVINPEALVIVIGGSICGLIIGFPFARIRTMICDVFETFRNDYGRDDLIRDLVKLSRTHRRADIRAVEKEIKNLKNDYLSFGMDLMLNRYRNEEIRYGMGREMSTRIMNYQSGQNILRTLARLTPAFGLVGTVMILIKMFSHLNSVETLAPLMASALMSTLYGVIVSNLIMLPLSARLADRAVSAEMIMSMTVEGILAIQRGEHPLRIEERLKGYGTRADQPAQRTEKVLAVKGI
ncbi:MAG: MotA/TolQ/ExbB proton channel family protein [Thermodesulfovibrionales bacterium]